MKNKNQQLGFSLVELMVGLIIGLLVSAIIVTVFTQSKKSYNQDEEIAQLLENGRYSLQLLTRELSMAGFTGSMNIVDDIGTTVTAANTCGAALASWSDVVNEPIIYTTTVPDCISGVKANTDILVIKRARGTSSGSQVLNKLYLQTSGKGGSVIAGVNGGSATSPKSDWEYLVRIYYIKDGTTPTLTRAQLKSDMNWTNEELVQGIENFKITFGVDSTTDGAVDSYTSSPTTTELKQSILAKVDILVRSINKDQAYTNNKTYFAGSTTIANTLSNTKYYGRVFSSTAAMRNISFKND